VWLVGSYFGTGLHTNLAKSLELALSNNSKRSQTDLARFQEMYGLNPEDMTPYTHVIDASGLTREEVLGAALKTLEELE
jgi:cytidylate kinase